MPIGYVVSPSVLYWGQPQLVDLVGAQRSKLLQDCEVAAWLSDLYWGELLAIKYARIRLRKAEPARKKVWHRICRDEMRHFSMMNLWFLNKDLLPNEPSPLFEKLFRAFEDVEGDPTPESLKFAEEIQVFLETLIHALIAWRIDYIIDPALESVLRQIQQDEKIHIHATIHESNQELDGQLLLTKRERHLFPMHFARSLLTRSEFVQARGIGLETVRKFVLKSEAEIKNMPTGIQ